MLAAGGPLAETTIEGAPAASAPTGTAPDEPAPTGTAPDEPAPWTTWLGLGAAGLVATRALMLSAGIPSDVLARTFDFRAFYVAARLWTSGAEIYDLDAQADLARRLFGPDTDPMGFFNPAPFAAAVATVSWLPLGQALAVWCALLDVAWLAALALLLRLVDARARGVVVAALVLSPPVLLARQTGQPVALLLLAVLGAWTVFARGRSVEGGLALSGLLLKPHFGVLAALWAAVAAPRRAQAIGGFAAGAVGWVVASVACVGVASTLAYPSFLLSVAAMGRHQGISGSLDTSLRGALWRLGDTPALTAAWGVLAVTVVGGVLLAVARADGWARRAGLLAPLLLLASPHALVHDDVLLLLPLAALAGRPRARLVVAVALVAQWVAFLSGSFAAISTVDTCLVLVAWAALA